MNERIKELAEQARLGRGPEKIKVVENGVVIFYIDELEKFGELIVKECAKVAHHYTPDTEELDYSHLIKDKILARFGVEE